MKSPRRPALEAAQLRKLRGLLRTILPSHRFYARKLAGVDLSARGRPTLAEFLRRLPFTTKAELVADQAAHPPFGTLHTYPLTRYARFHQTSGTTGTPLRWLDTAEDWSWMVDNWTQVYRQAGIGPARGDRIFFAFSFGPFIGFWLAFQAAERIGCLCIPGGALGSAARLRLMIDSGATVLCCTPTYALRLAEAAREEGVSLKSTRIRTLIVAGEPGGSIPGVRQRIADAWHGARVLDHHGMTEIGPVTYESPRRAAALVPIESAYAVEIIDPKTGAEVEVGETGELVLTALGRAGSPLLRYRTGDLVRKIFIGKQLAFDGGILGRADDMVVVRGVNLYPSGVEKIVRTFADVSEYRVEVQQDRGMTELTLRVEPTAGCTDATALAAKVATALETAFALRFPVHPVPTGSLPRFELKAKRWIMLPAKP